MKNKLTKKYCEICGEKLIKIISKTFNPYTGKQIIIEVCPNKNDCKHDGHDYENAGIFSYTIICSKCGDTYEMD